MGGVSRRHAIVLRQNCRKKGKFIMTRTKAHPKEFADIADNARALMEATADLTGQKVKSARKRLELALERGKVNGQDLVDASAEMATDNIEELRDRITAALDHGKEIYDDVHDDVVNRAKAADHTVHEHPYKVMGIALGVGAIMGYFISSHYSRNGQ
jgi:ElaB/YqjD/DUF883 family membrane-anchored ribosome-binding protein